jgi:23S rRNA (pseudouridine1915-N3)-methyltransferase
VRLRLIIVGKDKNEPIIEAANVYVERIARYFPIDVVELKEEPAKTSTPVARVRAVEAERIEKALSEGEHSVALDERGKELSSVDLSNRLKKWANEGRSSVAFIIGGPNGLDPEFVSKRAKETWSLSRMTLPHRIARLILAEQLYRACTIMRGEPYHK